MHTPINSKLDFSIGEMSQKKNKETGGYSRSIGLSNS